jgi:hypothetical protein
MPTQSKVIGNNVVTNPIGEKIEDNYIHIYPGTEVTIRLAKSFADELSDLGYVGVERTDDRTKSVDLPVNIIHMQDELMISFYRHDLGEPMPCKLHNFVIDGISDTIQDILRSRADVVSRIKYEGVSVVVGELPQVIHMYFDMLKLEKLGRKEEKLDSWFG